MPTGIAQYGFGYKAYRYADAGKYFSATIGGTPGTGLISGVTTPPLQVDSTVQLVSDGRPRVVRAHTLGSGGFDPRGEFS